jgi:hypothetical protein
MSSNQQTKINLPGIVNCLATSHCGCFIAVGIDEKVHVLQVKTFTFSILGVCLLLKLWFTEKVREFGSKILLNIKKKTKK